MHSCGMCLALLLMASSAGAEPLPECRPEGWKVDDPVVSSLGTACLEDAKLRQRIERRARNKDGAAAMLLAMFYRVEKGDLGVGLTWLRIAADTGEPAYLFSLASWLAERSEESDLDEARRAADAAATQGHERAALLAGDLWLRGRGDLGEAQRAYMRAIKLGNNQALLRMSSLKRIGEPNRIMLVESAAWLQLYLSVGAPNEYMRSKAQLELDAVRAMLPAGATRDITEKANELARHFGS